MPIRVSPTRMKLLDTKKRFHMAVRGHKLLKEKLEVLVRELINLTKEFEKQEMIVGNKLPKILERFLILRSTVSDEEMAQIVTDFPSEYQIKMKEKNIMNLVLPVFEIDRVAERETILSNTGLNPAFDQVLEEFDTILSDLLKLAELEFSIYEIAKIVETTKRRVNALEYILIPELSAVIKFITAKLDENERANTVRLMKIKDILSQKQA
ncbi:V-type ATP synthase subunit D [bacterium]|nr:V-type ATP synthase subunit D [bacterium]